MNPRKKKFILRMNQSSKPKDISQDEKDLLLEYILEYTNGSSRISSSFVELDVDDRIWVCWRSNTEWISIKYDDNRMGSMSADIFMNRISKSKIKFLSHINKEARLIYFAIKRKEDFYANVCNENARKIFREWCERYSQDIRSDDPILVAYRKIQAIIGE